MPIIMVTAMTDGDSLRRAFAAGATDYIRKPIIAVELIARVSTALTMMEQRTRRKHRERELESAIQELQVLRSCSPICLSCKRIRSPGGGMDKPGRVRQDLLELSGRRHDLPILP